jgi:hypothetical protein
MGNCRFFSTLLGILLTSTSEDFRDRPCRLTIFVDEFDAVDEDEEGVAAIVPC